MALSPADRQRRYLQKLAALGRGEPAELTERIAGWIDEALTVAAEVAGEAGAVPPWALGDPASMRAKLASRKDPVAALRSAMEEALERASEEQRPTLERVAALVDAVMLRSAA